VALEALEEEERNADDIWGDVKRVLKESADCTIRRRCSARRKKWMSEETWDMIK